MRSRFAVGVLVGCLMGNYVYGQRINYYEGNYGFGVTTPNQVIHVNGDIQVGRNPSANSRSGLYLRSESAETHFNWRLGNQITVDGGFEIARSKERGSGEFLPPYFTIGSTGNVGIGTTIPMAKLDVPGTVRVGTGFRGVTPIGILSIIDDENPSLEVLDLTGDTTATINIGSGSMWNLVANPISGTNAYGFEIKKSGSAKMVIDTDGNVGMGTLSPTQKLDVNGVIKAGNNYFNILTYYKNGTPSNGIKIVTNIPFSSGNQMVTLMIEGYAYATNTIGLILNWYIYADEFHEPHISSFGSYTPEIKLGRENGNVVIFINDRGYFHRFSIRGYAEGMGESSSWFKGWSVKDEALNGDKEKTLVYRNKFSGEVVVDGKMGIGTSIPKYMLDVNGTIRANEVLVNIPYWADFVFEPSYRLKSLEDLEAFINANRHLPDVPSEVEIRGAGVSLSEMQAVHMKKIEELTLYIIQLHKRIEALESQVRK
ncbi:hypothetical protein EBR96_07625 [bacterium]|nr:hypothetical protein [bacterium]